MLKCILLTTVNSVLSKQQNENFLHIPSAIFSGISVSFCTGNTVLILKKLTHCPGLGLTCGGTVDYLLSSYHNVLIFNVSV